MGKKETRDGYVVDIGCLRKYAQDELLERARVHTRECALMGHCVESGYGLVDEEGELALLDDEATPKIVSILHASSCERGIKLSATREETEQDMRTIRVEEA